MFRLALLLCLANLIVSAQPAINPGGIVNAASYAISGLPNSGIAQGSIFTIFGTRLAVTNEGVSATAFPLPTNEGLAGTTIKIEISGLQVFYAPMIYVSPGQLIGIMPSTVPTGKTVYVTVVTTDGQSNSIPLTVVPQSFGIFSSTASGTGPGAIQNFIDGQFPGNSVFSAARPDQIAVIWGTGLGAIAGDDATAPTGGNTPGFGAQVIVGGQIATIDYQGRAPRSAGQDQINFRVPNNVTGCYVPVVVKAGGVVSNTVTMSIWPNGGTCSEPLSFSDADMAAIQRDPRTLTLGAVNLKRTQSGGAVADSGVGWFGTYTADQIRFSRGLFATPSLGGCVVDQFSGAEFQPAEGSMPQVAMSAGSALAVTPSAGTARQFLNQANFYKGPLGGGDLTPFLNPGSFAITNQYLSAPPPPPILPFQANLSISSGVTWTNPPTSIPRTQDLTVTWSGGNSDLEYVRITGYSTLTGSNVGVGFVCSAPAGVGSFRVPATVLATLPAGAGKLQVGATALPSRIPQPNSSLNALYLSYNVSESRSVTYVQ